MGELGVHDLNGSFLLQGQDSDISHAKDVLTTDLTAPGALGNENEPWATVQLEDTGYTVDIVGPGILQEFKVIKTTKGSILKGHFQDFLPKEILTTGDISIGVGEQGGKDEGVTGDVEAGALVQMTDEDGRGERG